MRVNDTFIKAFLVASFVGLAAINAGAALDRGTLRDFVMLYVGARDAGTGALYDPESSYAFQRERWGLYQPSVVYTRLPFYALLLKPLSWFDYETAHTLWILLRLLAIGAFVWLWPQAKSDTALVVSISIAVYASLFQGQDALLLLPLLALFHRSMDRAPYLGGAALSLCAIKPHLVVLIPLLLIAQRRWKALQGMLAGGAVLFALSFIAGGPNWITDYLAVISSDTVHPSPEVMFNLHGLLRNSTQETIACLLLVAMASFAFQQVDFEYGLAMALVGSLLVSYHAYFSDTVVLIPAALILLSRNAGWAAKVFALLVLSPLSPIAPLLGQLSLVALFISSFLSRRSAMAKQAA